MEIATGVNDLDKDPPDALAAGAVVKVVPATGVVSAAGAAAIGCVVSAAAAGATTSQVRLVPAISGTATEATEYETPTHNRGTA